MITVPEEQIELSAELKSLVAEYIANGGEIKTFPQGASREWIPGIAGAEKARKSGSAKLRTSASASKAPETHSHVSA